MEQDTQHRPEVQEPGTAELPKDAAQESDPTLEELAALEHKVDNWLRPPVKAVPVSMQIAQPEVAVQEEAFKPEGKESPLPRARPRASRWALGIGALAAAVIAIVIVGTEQNPSDFTPDVVATDASDAPEAPVVPAPTAAESKPVDMVFLKGPAAAGAKVAEPPIQPADQETVEAAPPSDMEVEAPASAVIPPPVKTAKIAPAKKPAIRKTGSTALAERPESGQAGRRLSDTQRLDNAIIECNSNSRDPGACNLRACDVLGPSHPACRDQ